MTAQRILLILGLIVVVARSDVRGDAEERTLKPPKILSPAVADDFTELIDTVNLYETSWDEEDDSYDESSDEDSDSEEEEAEETEEGYDKERQLKKARIPSFERGNSASIKSSKAPTLKSNKSPSIKSTKAPTIKSTKTPSIKSAKSTKAPTLKSSKTSKKSRRLLRVDDSEFGVL